MKINPGNARGLLVPQGDRPFSFVVYSSEIRDFGIIGGGTPKTSVADYWNGDISWITPADLGKNTSKWILKGAKSITQKGLDESSAKLMPEGSVVYSSRAPIGHIAIAAHELCTNQGCKSFAPDTQFITTEWAYYMLIARTRDIQSRASGTTFKEISGKGIGETWVSLPPQAEQKRIVTRLEKVFAEIARAEKAYEELQTLAGVLRGQILQEAIQGKLVPQLAEEGVVEHIGAAPDEVPFEIPESWQWVQLNRICTLKSGVDMSPSVLLNEPVVDSIPYITGGSQIGQSGELLITRWTSKATNISEKGDVLLICKGSGLGRTALNSYGSVHIARQIMAIRKTKEAIPQYLDLLLKWRWESLRSAAKGVIPGISRKDVLSLLVPLPPVTEQVRIVAKVDDLLKQVNALSA